MRLNYRSMLFTRALSVAERDGTNGAPCLGVAVALGGALWLGVAALLLLALVG